VPCWRVVLTRRAGGGSTPRMENMSGNQEERNRFLGFQVGQDPHRPHGNPHRPRGREQQRVMGFPADWVDDANLDGLRFLMHPVREYKRWVRRRRLGAYATGETADPADRPEDR
jgi:hypothetical protein